MDLTPAPGEVYMHDSANYVGDTIHLMGEEFMIQPLKGPLINFSVE